MQHELDKPTSEPFHHLIQKYYNAIYYRLKWYHVRVGSLLHSTSHDDGITTSLVQAPQSQQMLQKVSQQSRSSRVIHVALVANNHLDIVIQSFRPIDCRYYMDLQRKPIICLKNYSPSKWICFISMERIVNISFQGA